MTDYRQSFDSESTFSHYFACMKRTNKPSFLRNSSLGVFYDLGREIWQKQTSHQTNKNTINSNPLNGRLESLSYNFSSPAF